MTAHQPRPAATRRGPSAASVVGIAIGLAGLAAVLVGLGRGTDAGSVVRLAVSADPIAVGLGVVLAAVSMGTVGVLWARVLRALGRPSPTGSVLRWYWLGSMGKYLPGGVWPIVGRAELAASGGIDRPTAYAGVGISIMLTYMAAALWVAIGFPFVLDAVAPGSVSGDLRLWSALVLPVGLALLHPGIGGRIVTWGTRRFSRRAEALDLSLTLPGPRSLLLLLVSHLPVWVLVGATQVLLTAALSEAGGFAAPDAWAVAWATVLAWLAGFLALPVPGGIGVREAVFVAALPAVPPELAAGAALLGRAVFVLGDAIAAGGVLLTRPARRPAAPERSTDPD